MKLSNQQVLVLWEVDEQGYRWPTLRERSGALLEPFTSYLEKLVADGCKAALPPKTVHSTVEAATYALVALAEFLVINKRRLYRINDDWLEELRDEILESVRSNASSRGGTHATKRTTNRKLENIYRFLYWCQKNRRLPAGTIGWLKCRVQSSLPEAETRAAPPDLRSNRLYPLCYDRVGGSTRQDEGQYWATSDDLIKIEDYFWETHSFPIAERNTLALRVQQITGWRNESVNSLTTEQFSKAALERKRTNAFCLISPPKQKFSYDKDFAVDWLLVDRIVEYINNGRKHLLERAGATEAETGGRLFISNRGSPLSDDTYGEIFTDAFRAIGAPKGAGGHSIRRYRTVEEVKAETSRRRLLQLPPDKDSVVAVVMELLGHNSAESGRAYDLVMQRVNFESRESELLRRLNRAEIERDRMKAQLARLLESLPTSVHAMLPSVVLHGPRALGESLDLIPS